MKKTLCLFAMALFVLSPRIVSAQASATANITAGRNQLKLQTPAALAQADSFFGKAITNNSSNLEANLLKAATSLILEQNSSQFQAQLTGVGVTINDNDIYNFLYTPPVDSDGFYSPTSGFTTNNTLTYIKSKMSLIDASLANLAKFGNATTSNFAINLTAQETSLEDVRIDYGDVLMLRALLKAAKAYVALMSSYNSTAEYAKIAYIEKNFGRFGKVTPQLILETFPDLMKFSTPDQRAAAKTLIIQANADYQLAHRFIMNNRMPGTYPNLFEYANPEEADTSAAQINTVVVSLNANADLPIPDTGVTINLSKILSSTTPLRGFVTSNSSQFEYGYPVRSSWPDPTFGGAVKAGSAILLDSLEDTFKETRVEQRLWRMAERPTRKGTIKAWGSNSSGQTAVPAGLTNVVQIAAGGNHSLALKADGTVSVWGSNNSGQASLPPIVTTLAGSGSYGSTDGQGTAASFSSPFGVAVDASGNVYVADAYSHKIRKITPSGTVTTLAGSGSYGSTDGQGTAASFDYPKGLAVDASGNVYVVDAYSNKIRKITPSGAVTTLAGSGDFGATDGQGAAASFAEPQGVAVDASGNVYVADTQNNKIRKITPSGTVTTLAGSGSYGSTDGQGTAASFAYPQGVAVDASGNAYVADNNNLRKITASGVVATIPGSGYSVALCIDQSGSIYTSSNNKISKFNPSIFGLADVHQISAGENHSLALNADGTVLGWGSNAHNQLSFDPYYWLDSPAVQVSAGGNHSLALDSEGNILAWGDDTYGQAPWGGFSSVSRAIQVAAGGTHSLALTSYGSVMAWGNNANGQTTVPAGFSQASFGEYPKGVAVDSSGNVYLADTQNNKIRKITANGTVTTLAGTGEWGSNDGSGATATFSQPAGIAVDTSGNVYVSEPDEGRIRKITSSGTVTTLAESVYGVEVLVVSGTTIYASDTYGHRILKISSGGVVSTLAGSGYEGSSNGKGTSASFYEPRGLAIDSSGNVYVADLNYKIRKISANGTVTNFVGSGNDLGADGVGSQASFGTIRGMVMGSDGALYVADTSNFKIRKVTSSGAVTTLAGTGWNGSTDGTGAGATFKEPSGIAFHSSGLYVAENYKIRKVSTTGVVTTFAGAETYGSQDGVAVMAVGNKITQIAAGGAHSLALTANRTVIAWGDNSSGQCSVPTGLTGVVQIAAGKNHSIAVKADGTIVAWGNNTAGQRSVPTGISYPIQASAGAAHSLVLMASGPVGAPEITVQPVSQLVYANSTVTFSVTATGANLTYQWLRNGATVAGATSSLYNFTATFANAGNYTARVSNSLGNATSEPAVLSFHPQIWTSVPSIGNFTTAAGTPSAAKSFTVNGTGAIGAVNIIAPLGFEVSTDNSTFSSSLTLGKQGGMIQSVYRGDFNKATGTIWESGSGKEFPNPNGFAAITSNGSAIYWGEETSEEGYNFNALAPSLSSNVTNIYSNKYIFAALLSDGSVKVWGNGNHPPLFGGDISSVAGQLSSNVTTISSTPMAFAALKKDGSVVTWGSGYNGGNSTSVASQLSSNVTAVYSNTNAFAALKKDGSVVTWGSDWSGGNSTSVASQLSSNVNTIYSTSMAFAALKKDGSVVTWGSDWSGGNSTSVASQLSSNVTAVYSNPSAFAALKKDGSVVTWGSDWSGGNSSVYEYIHGIGDTFTSVAAQLNSNVTAVYSNPNAFAALKKDGSVVTWGSGYHGGNSTSVASLLSSNFTAIYSTRDAFAALKKDGSVVTWGRSDAGGDSTAVAGALSSNVTEIYSNSSAFAAVKKDGSVVTWGDSNSGGANGPANIGVGEAPSLPRTIFVRLSSTTPSGQISGNVSVSSNGLTSQTVAVSGMVNPSSVPVITSNATANGTLNVPFSYQIAATNPPILSYSATLPLNSGLSLNSTTGLISGTPTTGGNFTVNLVARNLVGNSTVKQLALNIVIPPRIWTSVPSIGNFTAGTGSPSGARSFTINGTSLTGPVTLLAPPGFEVSTDNSTFSTTATLGTPGGRIQSVYRGSFNTATGKIWETGSGQEFPNSRAFAAITANGSVVTWGEDMHGGGGNSTSVAGLLSSNVTAVYSTTNAFAALKKDGSVVTWGSNWEGGEASYFAGNPAGEINVLGLLSSNVTSISSTSGAFAALKKGGSVVTWGYFGKGGDSSSVAGKLSSNVTAVYSNLRDFAALKSDGSVVIWPGTSSGNSTNLNNALSSNVASIFSNQDAFAALKKDGSVVTWGDPFSGGNSSIAKYNSSNIYPYSSYIYTSVASSLTSNVTAVFSNQFAFAALKKDGSVVTWGYDYSGGNSTRVANSLTSNVTAVFSSSGAFAALKKDGSVVTWGDDSSGGNSTSVSVSISSNVVTIYSNQDAFAALKKDGSVVTWGNPSSGGTSSFTTYNPYSNNSGEVYIYTSVASSLSSNVTAIFSNRDAFAALKKDGSVVTWGNGFNGGDSSAVSNQLSSNVTAIYSTETSFAAVKKDGSVVTWGEPASGGTNGPANIGLGGPPSLPATAYVRLSASNQTGPVSGNISISADGAISQNIFVSGIVNPSSVPVITSNATANGTLGAPFFYQITATNPPILAYSNSGNLPAGITLNGTTGIISGTANATGNFTVNLFARNSAGNSSARRLDIAIAPAPSPQITYFGTQGAVPFEAYNTFAAPVLQVLVFNPSGSAMKYQWFFNGAPIAGATQSTYNMGTASSARVGFYSVLVTNAANQSVSSPNLEFSLKPSAAFSVSGPVNQRFALGSNATYAVTDLALPSGNATVTYQWLKNGVVIPAATGVSYTIPNGVSASTAGAYAVQITTKIGNIVIGTVVSRSWSVALQDLGILIYNLAGNATRTSGAIETVGTISGYFLIDRANDNAAIIQTYGSGFAKRNSLEMRPDIAAASTGPVVGSRTVFAGSLNSGDVPVDHDMSWITGRDEEVTIATATTTPSVLPALKVFAPSAMSGTLGTLVRGLTSVEIDSFNVTLTINKPLTTIAIRNGHTLEQAILATRAAANAAGFIDDQSTPTPSTNMVLVQGGTLPLGSELAGQPVATFRIGKYEVTWDEWQTVRTWAVANGYSDLADVGQGAGGNHPVQNVSWYDVLKWCNAKSQKEGLMPVYNTAGAIYKTGQTTPTINPVSNGYRLPSEAEWEWAARGGVSSQGYTYSGSNDHNAVAWHGGNSSDGTIAVGTKAANELEIHDMSGNVWEWCWDIGSSSVRIFRGGSYGVHSDYGRVAVRAEHRFPQPEIRDANNGFRVARYTGE